MPDPRIDASTDVVLPVADTGAQSIAPDRSQEAAYAALQERIAHLERECALRDEQLRVMERTLSQTVRDAAAHESVSASMFVALVSY